MNGWVANGFGSDFQHQPGIGRIGRKLQRGVDETQNRTELIVRRAEFGKIVSGFPTFFGNDRFNDRFLAVEIVEEIAGAHANRRANLRRGGLVKAVLREAGNGGFKNLLPLGFMLGWIQLAGHDCSHKLIERLVH